MQHVQRIAILGLGQMGTSLGLALKRGGFNGIIAGFDAIASHSEAAFKLGAVDEIATSVASAAQQTDLIVLCVPVRCYAELMQNAATHLKEKAIISDIGSVKQAAMHHLAPHLPSGIAMVPSHPIAGSEKTGPHHARADFFDRKLFLITPPEGTSADAIATIAQLWHSCGAAVEQMEAPLHDTIYAVMSHLPQMMAFAAAPVLDEAGMRPAPDEPLFERFIRIGRSDPAMWCDVFLDNHEAVLHTAASITQLVTHLRDELIIGNGDRTSSPSHQELARLGKVIWPRMLASCLIMAAQLAESQLGITLARYAAGGFIDTTCPATESTETPDFELVSAHAPHLIVWLDRYLREQQQITDAITLADPTTLREVLTRCQRHALSLIQTRH